MEMSRSWFRVVAILGLLLLAAGAFVWFNRDARPVPAMVTPEGLPTPSSSRMGTSALSHGGVAPEPARNPSLGASLPGSTGDHNP